MNGLDLETQTLRRATLRDVADLAKLVDGLPYIDFYIRPIEPQDIPMEKMDINKYYASLANTSKHVMGNVYYLEKVKEVKELAEMLFGGKQKLREKPIIFFITSWMLNLLTLNSEVTKILIEIVKPSNPCCSLFGSHHGVNITGHDGGQFDSYPC